jgi:hypothetical protein
MVGQSKINYGHLDLTITQSGTTIISDQGLRDIFTEGNTSYEEIPGKYVVPSGGLAGSVSYPWAGSTVAINNNATDLTWPGADTNLPSTHSYLTGIDCGSAKYADTFLISLPDLTDWCKSHYVERGVSVSGTNRVFAVFGSNNNSTWTNLGYANEYTPIIFGTASSTFIRSSYRYFVVMRVNDAIWIPTQRSTKDCRDGGCYPISTGGIQFFDSQSTNDYEMLIDLGKEIYIEQVILEQESIKRSMAYPLDVSYSKDNILYCPAYVTWNGGFSVEPNPNELSPATSISSWSASSFYGRMMVYCPFNNSLYVFTEDRFHIFSLDTRTWSTSSVSRVSQYQASITIDIDENIIYGISSSGLFWKYVIESDEFTFLSGPPGSSLLGTGSTVTYAPINKSLYILRGDQVNTFWQYSPTTDTWTAKTNFTTTGTDGVRFGSSAVYSDYGPYIFVTRGASQQYTSRYDINANTWSTISNPKNEHDRGPGSTYTSSPPHWGQVVDNNRNILYRIGLGGYYIAPYYDIAADTWKGIHQSGSTSGSTGKWWVTLSDRAFLYSGYGGSTGQQRGGFGPHCGVAYVPNEDRIYVHGDTQLNLPSLSSDGTFTAAPTVASGFFNTLRMTAPLEELNQVKFQIQDVCRYIKIQPSSYTQGTLIRIKRLKITTADQKQSTLDIGVPSIGTSGTPKDFTVVNPLSTVATSGSAYINPNGSEGSRYYEIGVTYSGTYYSHCVNNDLANFQCLASNSNYDTTMCGKKCTAANGGISATDGYVPNVMGITFDTPLNPGESTVLFVRENIPVTKRELARSFEVTVDFDGEL